MFFKHKHEVIITIHPPQSTIVAPRSWTNPPIHSLRPRLHSPSFPSEDRPIENIGSNLISVKIRRDANPSLLSFPPPSPGSILPNQEPARPVTEVEQSVATFWNAPMAG